MGMGSVMAFWIQIGFKIQMDLVSFLMIPYPPSCILPLHLQNFFFNSRNIFKFPRNLSKRLKRTGELAGS